MADDVDPSKGADGVAYAVAQAIRSHGAISDGWIVPDTETSATDDTGTKTASGPLGAFAKVGESGLDVTVDTGEAHIGGSWLARDAQTTVTLNDNTAGQTIELGWDATAGESVLIGERGTTVGDSFDARDPSIPLYTFDTDSGAVVSQTNERVVGKPFGVDADGWRDDNDRLVYDLAAGAVPQTRQGGPAGKLSGYPLGPSDLGAAAHQVRPNVSLPISEIPDNDHAAQPVHIPDGKTLYLWAWGCRDDTQSTPSGLAVELVDETNAMTVTTANTAWATGDPIASLSATNGALDATLRLVNSTNGTVNAGAEFAITKE